MLGNDGCFYRKPLALVGNTIRYGKQPLGVNKLEGLMKEMCQKAGLTGNYTNHSGKRTCATALYKAGLDEQTIMDRQPDLKQCGIETIEANAFFNITGPLMLSLQRNRIRVIQSKAFRDLIGVEIINLDDNFLQTIKSETFVNMPNLDVLSLYSNSLICDCRIRSFHQWVLQQTSTVADGVVCSNINEQLIKDIPNVEECKETTTEIESSTITTESLETTQPVELTTIKAIVDHKTTTKIEKIKQLSKIQSNLWYSQQRSISMIKRGADAASDHHLLIGKIRMKLRKVYNMKNSSRVKYNVNFLREKTEKEQFNITLSNKFQLLEELDNIEDQWSQIKEEVRQCVRKDKRAYIENLASQAEEAANMRNMKDLYDTTKKLAGKFRQTGQQVKDKNGKVLTTIEEQIARWAEYFKELLNKRLQLIHQLSTKQMKSFI
ncbi:unnamed protein product [Mytilus edulis]|uniref:LRRCT domain-containing protein n=1 Tax=Mytilus edulis TaxID=6550 RepID=A0A8S3TKJ5_MYTED|nr:unnamed protein product [Mytilus edulis]